MLRAISCERDGGGDPRIADEVVLDFDQRHRRRIAMRATGGLAFLLDLPQPTRLRDGDALLLEDGSRVRVKAADEPLTRITASSAAELMRIAWHLGNRHLMTRIEQGRLVIRRDHVIEEMVAGLGGEVAHIDAPFDPEGGAYAAGAHGHSHSHGDATHDHSHAD